MNRLRHLLAIVPAVGAALLTRGAFAQAVQLPSFHYFTVQTTVSVPDRGAANLGGVRRAASGSVGRGIPLLGKVPGLGRLGRNNAYGSSIGASDVSVTATIIDHRELDEAVLAEARARRAAAGIAAAPTTERATEPLRSPLPDSSPVASVADIRRQNEAQDATLHQEALALVTKGRTAEAAGKRHVAKIYYEMAARRADDALRQHIAEHLKTLGAEEPRVAATRP